MAKPEMPALRQPRASFCMMSQPITHTVRHLVLAASNEDGLEGLGSKFALRICKALPNGSLCVFTSNPIALTFGIGLATLVDARSLFSVWRAPPSWLFRP